MCLITVIPSTTPAATSEKAVDAVAGAWFQNSDGAGLAYVRGDRVVIRKPFYEKDKFLRALRQAIADAAGKSDVIAHLRYATHGDLSKRNVHPHLIGVRKDMALAHNGIFRDFGAQKLSGDSDTVEFCRNVLDDATPENLLNPAALSALGDMIGLGNKLAILGPFGVAHIVNAAAGAYADGVWYSNAMHRHDRPVWTPTSEYGQFRRSRYGRGVDGLYTPSGDYGRPAGVTAQAASNYWNDPNRADEPYWARKESPDIVMTTDARYVRTAVRNEKGVATEIHFIRYPRIGEAKREDEGKVLSISDYYRQLEDGDDEFPGAGVVAAPATETAPAPTLPALPALEPPPAPAPEPAPPPVEIAPAFRRLLQSGAEEGGGE